MRRLLRIDILLFDGFDELDAGRVQMLLEMGFSGRLPFCSSLL